MSGEGRQLGQTLNVGERRTRHWSRAAGWGKVSSAPHFATAPKPASETTSAKASTTGSAISQSASCKAMIPNGLQWGNCWLKGSDRTFDKQHVTVSQSVMLPIVCEMTIVFLRPTYAGNPVEVVAVSPTPRLPHVGET